MRHLHILLLLLLFSGCATPQPALVAEGEQVTAEPAVIPSAHIAVTEDGDLALAVRRAVDRSLPFIEQQGTAWMDGRVSIQEGAACVSCHHVGYALWTHAEARRVGIETLAPEFRDLAHRAVEFLDQPSIPRALSVGHVMLAEPQQAEALRSRLLDLQNAAGDWSAKGQFPSQRRPIEESDAIATIYALLALKEVDAVGDSASTATAPGEALAANLSKALDWIDQQPAGESTEWLAWRLVLASSFDTEDQVSALRQQLVERQNEDGGWGWEAESESDAFSTGQALYALATVTARGSDGRGAADAVEGARRFLVEDQGEDGTWQTASSVVSDEPSAEKDVIYHYWGTAWATLGLARSLDT